MYKISEVDLKADTIDAETPTEIINAVMSYNKKVFPAVDLQPEINKLSMTGMYLSQVAYSLAVSVYETATETARDATRAKLSIAGIDIENPEISDSDFDKWAEIEESVLSEFGAYHFMYLKWKAEEKMVSDAFRIVESDPKTKRLIATGDGSYEKLKADWKKHPSVTKKVIDLAFKLRA